MRQPQDYRAMWNQARAGNSSDALRHVASQAALSFLDRCLYNDNYVRGHVALLCDMATDDHPVSREAGTAALFGIVVESLCDDFEEFQTIAYNRVMSQVIDHCRRLPECDTLDIRLHAFGIETEEDLFDRCERLRLVGDGWRGKLQRADCIIVLSRVTIGADVALTSVILQRVLAALPGAAAVVLGGPRQAELFAAHPRVRVRSLHYPRRGGLQERLDVWLQALAAVEEEAQSAGPERTVVIDPDSRLSQLGVLPLIEDSRYFFMNTRAHGSYAPTCSMSEMGNQWMDGLLGQGDAALPAVWLPPERLAWAAEQTGAWRERGARQIVAVNLGVGGNPRKRVGDGFEEELLVALATRDGSLVVLDKGFGEVEEARAEALLAAVGARGIPVQDASVEPAAAEQLGQGVVAMQLSLADVAALIGCCDAYIGYDSAGQHIAAAVGADCRTVFAGTNNPRFVRRWRPCGPGDCEFVHVDTLTQPRVFDDADIVARVLAADRTDGAADP